MDNKAYLDEIAVKSQKKSGFSMPTISPLIIKLLVTAVIATIAILVVSFMINNKNIEKSKVDQRVYARIASLLDYSQPLLYYQNDLRSAELRGYTLNLVNSLKTAQNNLLGVASVINVDPAALHEDVIAEEAGAMSEYGDELESAKLNGRIDRNFAISTTYQITMLMSIEQQALGQSTNAAYSEALSSSIDDLEIIYESFKNYGDSN